MKKSIATILVLLVAAALLSVPAAAEDSVKDKVILVSGNGYSETSPDKVTITFGVQKTDPDAKKAQTENAEAVDKIIRALKNAGIKEENIKTSGYSIYSYAISEYQTGPWKTGTVVYEVTNSVQIISYDVDKAGSYIDLAVDAGANKVNGLSFGLSNEKQIIERNKAIISAVKAAKADADSVASALGILITGTGKISVDQSYTPVSYPTSSTYAKAGEAMDAAVGVPTTIQSGEIKTTASVSIAYMY